MTDELRRDSFFRKKLLDSTQHGHLCWQCSSEGCRLLARPVALRPHAPGTTPTMSTTDHNEVLQ
jgi:hypothetical protein